MVFLTSVLCGIQKLYKKRFIDKFWKKRRVFLLTAHYYGKRRNCYRIAAQGLHRALATATKTRAQKKLDMTQLWVARISAGCEENGVDYNSFHEALLRSDIFLNKKVLADLAVWEPKTFSALSRLAWSRAHDDGMKGVLDLGEPPKGVFTRNMLK